jgi:2-polyprenyl-3-methyl-5-hydroxy-6-metoxy-1,4-benzoquinol methylase
VDQFSTQLASFGLSAADIEEASKLLKETWYYRVQFTDDTWTEAQHFDSVALTRTLLSRIDLKDATVLDLGTMEGMIPILSHAAGAKRVTAYDRLTGYRQRVAFLQKLYRREFEYINGMSLAEFQTSRDTMFDVVVFSGVLYHMFDPFSGLARAASLARPGGIFILETSAVVYDDCALHFNKAGRYYPGTTFFQPTPDALDNFLRFYGLSALDVEFQEQRTTPYPLIRIAIACRVGTKPLPDVGDKWMEEPFFIDLREFNMLRRNSGDPLENQVPFTAKPSSQGVTKIAGSMNLPRYLATHRPLLITPDLTELSLTFRRRD